MQSIDELQRVRSCNEQKTYCTKDDDCRRICSTPSTGENIIYNCNELNVCIQSIGAHGDDNSQTTTSVFCNRKFGFFPVLTADEIFKPHWICLNTRPNVFDDNQNYHPYICAGSDISHLNPDEIFNSCICPHDKVKVRDEFRNNIPVCIDQHQLSLFPNFTLL